MRPFFFLLAPAVLATLCLAPSVLDAAALAVSPATVMVAAPSPLQAAPAGAVAAGDPALTRVVELTNAERAAVGVGPLAWIIQQ